MDSTNQPIRISFEVMGLRKEESDFLNWAMSQYDNLQFLKESDFLKSKSIMVEVYFNDLDVIKEIRKPTVCKRK
jgi:hypothetical protein